MMKENEESMEQEMNDYYKFIKKKYETMSSEELLNFGNKERDHPLSLICIASNNDFKDKKCMKKWLSLMEFVLTKQPKLLDDIVVQKMYNFPFTMYDSIFELYSKYYNELEECKGEKGEKEEKCCSICLSSIFRNKMLKMCECEAGKNVHIFCAQKLIRNEIFNCGVCKKKYDVCEPKFRDYELIDPQIYFPFQDCYPSTLFANRCSNIGDNFYSKLERAIIFLQVNRVKYLLDNASEQEINGFLKNNLKELFHTKDNILKIKYETMPSNLSRMHNRESFSQIEQLVSKKLKINNDLRVL